MVDVLVFNTVCASVGCANTFWKNCFKLLSNKASSVLFVLAFTFFPVKTARFKRHDCIKTCINVTDIFFK